jgi:hypothetical protein
LKKKKKTIQINIKQNQNNTNEINQTILIDSTYHGLLGMHDHKHRSTFRSVAHTICLRTTENFATTVILKALSKQSKNKITINQFALPEASAANLQH